MATSWAEGWDLELSWVQIAQRAWAQAHPCRRAEAAQVGPDSTLHLPMLPLRLPQWAQELGPAAQVLLQSRGAPELRR